MLTGCIVIRAWSMAWSAYWTQFPLLINLHASQPPPQPPTSFLRRSTSASAAAARCAACSQNWIVEAKYLMGR